MLVTPMASIGTPHQIGLSATYATRNRAIDANIATCHTMTERGMVA